MYARLPDERRELYQWDTKQYLEVSSDVGRIDFQFRDTRDIVYGVFSKKNRVYIPDILLQQHGVIDCLVMIETGGLHTIQRMEIAVIERPMPPGYVVTEQGQIISYGDFESVLGKFNLLHTSGGTMAGNINMSNYMVTGLGDAERNGDAVSKHYADGNFLNLNGGTMRGRVRGLQQPINNDEPATKAYADGGFLKLSGGAMTGKITGIQTPTESTGAASKGYVDGRHAFVSLTIPKSGWTGSAAPYSNVVNVSGMLADDRPILDVVPSSTLATAQQQMDGYAMIYRAVTAAGKITFYATDKPSVDIPVQLNVTWRA